LRESNTLIHDKSGRLRRGRWELEVGKLVSASSTLHARYLVIIPVIFSVLGFMTYLLIKI
jgi:hypothetical protein